jgi:hypothetical protein
MKFINLETSAIIAAVISTLALLYSIWSLIRAPQVRWYLMRRWATPGASSTACRIVDKDDFLLGLIATYEPRVKEILSPPPDEVVVSIQDVSGPINASTGSIRVRRGDQEQEVRIDLKQKDTVRSLFEALLNRNGERIPKGERVA